MKNEYKIIRWWCVRHAIVTPENHNGYFYGGSDVDCSPQKDLSSWNASILPNDALLITSELKRTQQTANAICVAGLSPTSTYKYSALNEQSFGDWEKLTFAEIYADRDTEIWWDPAHTKIKNGESFVEMFNRVSQCVDTINDKHSNIVDEVQNIIAVTHGGVIRAKIAKALKIPFETALNIVIDNQSVTLLEYFVYKNDTSRNCWRCKFINRLSAIN